MEAAIQQIRAIAELLWKLEIGLSPNSKKAATRSPGPHSWAGCGLQERGRGTRTRADDCSDSRNHKQPRQPHRTWQSSEGACGTIRFPTAARAQLGAFHPRTAMARRVGWVLLLLLAALPLRASRKSSTASRLDRAVRRGDIPALVAVVRRKSANGADKTTAAGKLWKMALNNYENQVAITACADAIPALVSLARGGSRTGADDGATQAVGVLAQLPFEKAIAVSIVSHGAIPILVSHVRGGSAMAAVALTNLASHSAGIRKTIVSAGAIPELVSLLQDGTEQLAKESAAETLLSLALEKVAAVLIASHGAIPVLVSCVQDGSDYGKETAAIVLTSLASNSADIRTIIVNAGAIPVLVVLEQEGTKLAKEYAAIALQALSFEILSHENSAAIIPALVAIVARKIARSADKTTAARKLWETTYKNVENRVAIAACADAIPALVSLAKYGNRKGAEDGATRAVRVLAQLAVEKAAAVSIASHGGAIPILVSHVRDGSEYGKAIAALALTNLLSHSNAHSADIGETVVNAGAIPVLVPLLQDGTDLAKEYATETLQSLSIDKAAAISIASHGAIPIFVSHVRDGNKRSKEMAAKALMHLVIHSADIRKTIVDAGAIPVLVSLLQDGTDLAKRYATETLQALSIEKAAAVSIASHGAIPIFVSHVRDGNKRSKEMAAFALSNLASQSTAIRKTIVNAGAIPVLVSLLQDGTVLAKQYAAETLQSLSVKKAAAVSIASHGAIPIIVSYARDGSEHGKGIAALALTNLASHSAEFRKFNVNAGAIPVLVVLEQKGTKLAKEYAAIALQALSFEILSHENSAAIIPALVAIVVRKIARSADKTTAAGKLWDMAQNNYENRVAITACADAIPALVSLARDGNRKGADDAAMRAVGVLAQLAVEKATAVSIASHGAIPILVSHVQDGSEYGKAVAAIVLSNLASHSADIRKTIINAGVIPVLVSLLRKGNEEGRGHAIATLRVLSSSSSSTPFLQSSIRNIFINAGAIPLLVARAGNYTTHYSFDAQIILCELNAVPASAGALICSIFIVAAGLRLLYTTCLSRMRPLVWVAAAAVVACLMLYTLIMDIAHNTGIYYIRAACPMLQLVDDALSSTICGIPTHVLIAVLEVLCVMWYWWCFQNWVKQSLILVRCKIKFKMLPASALKKARVERKAGEKERERERMRLEAEVDRLLEAREKKTATWVSVLTWVVASVALFAVGLAVSLRVIAFLIFIHFCVPDGWIGVACGLAACTKVLFLLTVVDLEYIVVLFYICARKWLSRHRRTRGTTFECCRWYLGCCRWRAEKEAKRQIGNHRPSAPEPRINETAQAVQVTAKTKRLKQVREEKAARKAAEKAERRQKKEEQVKVEQKTATRAAAEAAATQERSWIQEKTTRQETTRLRILEEKKQAEREAVEAAAAEQEQSRILLNERVVREEKHRLRILEEKKQRREKQRREEAAEIRRQQVLAVAAEAAAAAEVERRRVRAAAIQRAEQFQREQYRRHMEAQDATRRRQLAASLEREERQRQHQQEVAQQLKQLEELEAMMAVGDDLDALVADMEASDEEGKEREIEGKADGEADGKGGDVEATGSECDICFDAEKTHAFVPCGHQCVCEGCAVAVMATSALCPFCRDKAVHIMRVHKT